MRKTVQYRNIDFSLRATLYVRANFPIWNDYGNDEYDNNDDIGSRSKLFNQMYLLHTYVE
jgi:hypothetical protein